MLFSRVLGNIGGVWLGNTVLMAMRMRESKVYRSTRNKSNFVLEPVVQLWEISQNWGSSSMKALVKAFSSEMTYVLKVSHLRKGSVLPLYLLAVRLR